ANLSRLTCRRIKVENAKHRVTIQHGLHHFSVPHLENVQRQQTTREKDNLGQRKERQFGDSASILTWPHSNLVDNRHLFNFRAFVVKIKRSDEYTVGSPSFHTGNPLS